MHQLSCPYAVEVEYLNEEGETEFCDYETFDDARYEIEYNKQEGFNAVQVSVFPRLQIQGLTLDEAITEYLRFEETLKKNGHFTE